MLWPMERQHAISLFIPCLVENFLPEVGEAAVRLLTRLGARVTVPKGQTCCGQPVYKAGCVDEARNLARRMLDVFEMEQPVVSPSGSCVRMVREYPALFSTEPEAEQRARRLASRTYELTEYIVRVLGVGDVGASFAGSAVYHDSCQVGRGLGVVDEPRRLLAHVRGLDLLEPARGEMCCGFGGIFSLQHPELAAALVGEKVDDILAAGADTVVTAEASCLFNIRTYAQKQGIALNVLHIAQVLASGGAAA